MSRNFFAECNISKQLSYIDIKVTGIFRHVILDLHVHRLVSGLGFDSVCLWTFAHSGLTSNSDDRFYFS